MFTDLMSLSTFSSAMSIFNSIMSVLSAYQYKTGNRTFFSKIMPIILLVYLVIDTCLHIYTGAIDNLQYIIHHVVSICFTLWGTINNYGIDNFKNVVYILLITESSTFFLNLNMLIKKYLEFNANSGSTLLKTVLEKISVLNYVFFIPLFIYTRFYKVFSELLFNPDFYTSLLSPRDDIYHYLNRGILVFLLAFTILNFYWMYLIFKNTSRKLIKFVKSKLKSDDKMTNDNDEEDFSDPKEKTNETTKPKTNESKELTNETTKPKTNESKEPKTNESKELTEPKTEESKELTNESKELTKDKKEPKQ
jgi:hypothetical protein